MRNWLFGTILFLTYFGHTQDPFSGTFVRFLTAEEYELIQIEETEDCYSAKFATGLNTKVNWAVVTAECYVDEEDEEYFFIVLSWQDMELELSPLEWDLQGRIAVFELLADFDLPEPLIFTRVYE